MSRDSAIEEARRDRLFGLMANDDRDFGIAALISQPDWMGHAACRGGDPNEFVFQIPPGKHSKTTQAKIDRAKAVCARCDVSEQCLADALVKGETGVWGGTTETERRTIRRKRRDAA